MVTLYVANKIDEINCDTRAINIPEGLHLFFRNKFKNIFSMMIINDLSIYGEEVLHDREKISSLLELSDKFKSYEGENKKRVRSFFRDLENLCLEAIKRDTLLISVSD
jgi:hypothetical protein